MYLCTVLILSVFPTQENPDSGIHCPCFLCSSVLLVCSQSSQSLLPATAEQLETESCPTPPLLLWTVHKNRLGWKRLCLLRHQVTSVLTQKGWFQPGTKNLICHYRWRIWWVAGLVIASALTYSCGCEEYFITKGVLDLPFCMKNLVPCLSVNCPRWGNLAPQQH